MKKSLGNPDLDAYILKAGMKVRKHFREQKLLKCWFIDNMYHIVISLL